MDERRIKGNRLLELSIEFSLEAMKLSEKLMEKKHYILAKQLFRSCTSIGACVMEAQNAESRSDFIHKLKIAAKEADESQYWLIIAERASENEIITPLMQLLQTIQRILTASINTSRSNRT